MLASAVVAGLLAGIASRGSLHKLATIRVRWWPLFVAAIALRAFAYVPIGDDRQRAIFVVALWMLTSIGLANIALPGARFITAGIAANAIAVTSNGGAMPVSLQAVEVSATRAPSDALHQVMPIAPIFGDVIPIPALGVYSAGDLLLSIGAFVLIVATMRDSS